MDTWALLLAQKSVLTLFLGLLSVCVGSLLNVIIYRLPLMLQEEWQQECALLLQTDRPPASKALNLFFPRSFCPQCKRKLSAWHNIPLLSYFLLGGRCYHCAEPISWRYPAVELLTLVLSLVAAWQLGFTAALPWVLLATWLLICLFFIDLEHQLLPDSLTLSLLWLGLLANTQALFTPLTIAVYGVVAAYSSLWLLIRWFYLLTGKVGMGHGDFKLFAALGAWLGLSLLPLILLIASVSGLVVGSLYLKIQKKPQSTAIAFGPYLCVAGFIALVWGGKIIT